MSIQDLTTMIQASHGVFKDDPQSGSILKLLGENGFKQKMESGLTSGHTYTIIHNPPSTEFVLVDHWTEGGHPRKAYHAFSVRTSQKEHPMITYLKDLNNQVDQLLVQIQKYA